MKKFFLITCIMIANTAAFSQNNIFPENVNIGIGTTNPLFALDIQKPGLNTGIHLKKTDGTTASWYIHSGRLGGGEFSIGDDAVYRMVILPNGNVGIGTPIPQEALSVNGKIRAKEIKVEGGDNWPDYVFSKGYKYKTLPEIDLFIKANGHLPDMLSAKDVKNNGIDLGDMDKKLLQKIEELTLHLIDKDKQLSEVKTLSSRQEKRIAELESTMKMIVKRIGK